MIRSLLLTLLLTGACANEAAPPEELGYPLSVKEARSKLRAAKFEKGIIPGFSSHTVKFVKNADGEDEWLILTESKNGIYCPAKLMPANAEGTRTAVINECRTQIVGPRVTAALDELVRQTLTAETTG